MNHRDHDPQPESSAEADAGKGLSRRETIYRAGVLTLAAALAIPTAGLAAAPTRSASRFQFKWARVEGDNEDLGTLEVDEKTAELLARDPESFRLDWYDREQSGSRPISSLRFDARYQVKMT